MLGTSPLRKLEAASRCRLEAMRARGHFLSGSPKPPLDRLVAWGRLGAMTSAAAALACASAGAPEATGKSGGARDEAHAAAGSSIVLDRGRLVAYAADADNRAVHRVDLGTGDVSSTALPGRPEQIVLIESGRVARALVTLRDVNQVAAIEMDERGGDVVATAPVAPDPWGLALTPDGDVLVTSALGHTLTALDAETLEERWTLDVGREPRSVVVTPDGARAFVTHLVGAAVSVVDLTRSTPRVRRLEVLGGRHRDRVDRAIGAGTLHPTASLGYSAALDDEGRRLFVPHLALQNGSDTPRSIPGAYGGVPVEEDTTFSSVAVVATRSERLVGDLGYRPESLDGSAPISSAGVDFSVAPSGAPSRHVRGATVMGELLLVASFGTDELCALDARAIDPAMSPVRCFAVGSGPTGVAADPTTRIAVTWDQHDHAISVVDVDSGSVERIEVAADPLPADVAAGRRLFVTERDRRITRDGRSCAGCHPDGRDDGLVWKLGSGPRQTPTLVGRTERGPFGWLGKHARLEDNMRETMGRLGGAGLPDRETAQLAAFLRHGLFRATGHAERSDAAMVARGKEIFTSAETGCAGCHTLDREASDRAVHTVGSKAKTDTTPGFRTPPLLFVGATAPYFHDGRYQTLEALLADNLDRMGTTSHLSRDDLAALAAFLRTL